MKPTITKLLHRGLLLIATIVVGNLSVFGQAFPELMYFKFDTIISGAVINEAPASTRVGLASPLITGTTLTVDSNGLSGKALRGIGGGTSDLIQTGWNTNLVNTDWTISFWIKDVPSSATLWYLFGDAGNALRCFVNGAPGQGNMRLTGTGLPTFDVTGVTGGTFVLHFVRTQVPNELRAYRNGVLVNTAAITGTQTVGTGFRIGSYTTGSALNGLFDEFRMYNRALSQAEITATWNTTLVQNPCVAPPVGGQAVSSTNNACVGQNFTLTLSGASIGLGMSYQWESSTDSIGPYSPIANDTAAFSIKTQLSTNWYRCMLTCNTQSAYSLPIKVETDSSSFAGMYTIDTSISISSTNYHSLSSLINQLNCRGVSAPVTIHIAPGMGIFNENVSFGNISGASDINTITIKGNLNTIRSNVNPVIGFNQSRHIILDSLSIIADGATGYAVHMTNQTQFITITNCNISASLTATATTSGCIMGSASLTSLTAGNNAQYITIENNVLDGGYYSVGIFGNTTYLGSSGLIIRNNRMLNQYYYGVYLSNTDTTIIEGNEITRSAGRTAVASIYYGIYIVTGRNVLIRNNQVHTSGAGSTSSTYGISMSTSQNLVGAPTRIENNLVYNIQTGGAALVYGIHLLGTLDRLNIYHNTVDMMSTGTTGARRAINFGTAPNNTDHRNNIYTVHGSGTGAKHCIYVTTTSTTFTSNNNVYSMTSTAGTNALGFWTANRNTLLDWQTASTQDAGSSALNPVYVDLNAGFLKPLSVGIDNLGAPVGVTTDILGVTRSITTPDVGAYEFTGISGDMSISDARLARVSQCYGTTDSVYLTVNNLIGTTVDFIVNPLTVVYEVTGPVVTVDSIVIFSGALAVGNSLTVFANNVDMSVPGNYTLRAYIRPNAVNVSALNDTFTLASQTEVKPILSVTPRTGLAVSPTDTFVLEAMSPLFPRGNVFFSEISQFKTTTGQPIGGWPTYLIADDYVEITGVPSTDLAGFTLEVWTTTALQHTVTFGTGTLFSPSGTMVIATGQLGASVPSPSNFYYHSGNTTSYTSTVAQGYIIRNATGDIVDAVGYGSFTFPIAAGVTAADWTGSTTAANSGIRLISPDNNTSSNWVNSSVTPQDPNVLNSGVPLPTPGSMAGFNWTYLGGPLDTNAKIVVGPYTVPGIYEYVATYTNACGTFFDTVTITAASTVPVTLSKLEAIKRSSNVVVQWSTASEINNSHFVVERSIDGINFEGIGRVRGNGTTSRSMQYSYTDEGVLDQYSRVNTIYYRLRQVDFDGSEELSRVVRVQNNQNEGARAEVLPNPNRGSFVLELSTDWENEATVTIYNMTGSAVYSTATMLRNGTNRMDMDLNLPSGVYSIVVTHQGIQTVKRFVIE